MFIWILALDKSALASFGAIFIGEEQKWTKLMPTLSLKCKLACLILTELLHKNNIFHDHMTESEKQHSCLGDIA